MTTSAESEPDDAPLWPLVQVLGDIARRVEREDANPKEQVEDDESGAV